MEVQVQLKRFWLEELIRLQFCYGFPLVDEATLLRNCPYVVDKVVQLFIDRALSPLLCALRSNYVRFNEALGTRALLHKFCIESRRAV
jgi:hypothetical protein